MYHCLCVLSQVQEGAERTRLKYVSSAENTFPRLFLGDLAAKLRSAHNSDVKCKFCVGREDTNVSEDSK